MIISHKLIFLRCHSHSVPEPLAIKIRKIVFFPQVIHKHVTNSGKAHKTYLDQKPHLRKGHMPMTQGSYISRQWMRDEITIVQQLASSRQTSLN